MASFVAFCTRKPSLAEWAARDAGLSDEPGCVCRCISTARVSAYVAPAAEAGASPRRARPHTYVCGRLPFRLSRHAWFALACTHALLSVGVLFGWASLAAALRSEGVGGASSGPASVFLVALFNAGSIASFVAPILVGALMDAAGPRAALSLTLSVALLGCAAAVVAVRTRSDGVWFCVTVCLGVAATAQMLPLYGVANLFPGREGLVLAIFNGCFDAASVVFLIFSVLYARGLSLSEIWLGYTLLVVLPLWMAAVLVWRPVPFVPIATHQRVVGDVESATSSPRASPVATDDAAADAPGDALPGLSQDDGANKATGASKTPVVTDTQHEEVDEVTDVQATSRVNGSDAQPASMTAQPGLSQNGHSSDAAHSSTWAQPRQNTTPTGTGPTVAASPSGGAPLIPRAALAQVPAAADLRWADRIPQLHRQSLLQQLMSPEWLCFLPFFCVCLLRYNAYLGSVDAQLTALGQSGSEYTGYIGIILPLGFFVQFVVGPVLDRRGLATASWCLWALGVVFSVLSAIPNLQVQVLTCIVFVGYRAFLFSTMTTYMARVFGFKNYGGVVGGVMLIAGSFAMISSALVEWAVNEGANRGRPNGDFSSPNYFLLGLILASIAFPIWFTRHDRLIREHTAAKREQQLKVVRTHVRRGLRAAAKQALAASPVASAPAAASLLNISAPA